MKREMILDNGVRIEFVEDGVNVISSDGEVIQFNNVGKICSIKNGDEKKFIRYIAPDEADIELICSGLDRFKVSGE